MYHTAFCPVSCITEPPSPHVLPCFLAPGINPCNTYLGNLPVLIQPTPTLVMIKSGQYYQWSRDDSFFIHRWVHSLVGFYQRVFLRLLQATSWRRWVIVCRPVWHLPSSQTKYSDHAPQTLMLLWRFCIILFTFSPKLTRCRILQRSLCHILSNALEKSTKTWTTYPSFSSTFSYSTCILNICSAV